MERDNARVAVVGAGSWGTALAAHLATSGVKVTLWAREPEVVAGINTENRNPLFLSDADLPASLKASGDLEATIAGSDMVVSAVPVQHMRSALTGITPLVEAPVVVTVSKGIETETLVTPHTILSEVGVEASRIIALSGPSFAREVVSGRPTAVVAAGNDASHTSAVQEMFSWEHFRVYASDDLIGVELGGALKNVIALVAGVSDGLGLGDNARGAIITRGLAEVTRLGVALGGHPATFAGLSGIGDLVLTCTGDLSRNRSVGFAIGQGRKLEDIRAEMNEVAEGVPTCRSAHELAARVGVEMPITDQMFQVLYEDKDPREGVADLFGRVLREEREHHRSTW